MESVEADDILSDGEIKVITYQAWRNVNLLQ